MNNLSSYCGLVDAKIKASDKDLPVTKERTISVRTFFALLHTLKVKPFAMLTNTHTHIEGVDPIDIFNPVLSKIELDRIVRTKVGLSF